MTDFASVLDEKEDEEEEEEKEIYDVPPPARALKISHDYLNFKELEVLPIPSLPPKKRTSVNLDEKFGIISSSDRICISAAAFSGTESAEINKKQPVAAPRMKSVVPKQPMAMPRNKTRVDGVLPVKVLPDASATESCDFGLRYDPSNDRQNNNLGNFSNSNTVEADNNSGSAFGKNIRPVFKTDHSVTKPDCSLNNLKNPCEEYINTDTLIKSRNSLHDEMNDESNKEDYMNMNFDTGKGIPNTCSATAVFANSGQWTNISDLRAVASIASALKIPVPQTIDMQDALKSNDSEYMHPYSSLNTKDEDYSNVTDFVPVNHTNEKKLAPADNIGINLKNLMVNCLNRDSIPPSLSTSTNHVTSSASKAISIPDSFDPLYEMAPNEDIDSLEFFGSRNSTEVEMISSSSPPKITPPPLPDGLLIDFSDDNFYRLPVIPAPVIPCRPGQSDEPPPPVPFRKNSIETQTESKLDKPLDVPAWKPAPVPVVEAAATSPAVISPPARRSGRKTVLLKTASKVVEEGSRSVFYVGSGQNAYEPAPIAYEMEAATTSPSPSNGLTSSDQNELYEETDLSQKSNLVISHQGFLYLTGNIPKPEKKWCKLDFGNLLIRQNNQNDTSPEIVEKISMVSISSIKDDSKQNCCFELSTRPPTAYYQFSSDSSAEKATWITCIARNMALVNSVDLKHISNINRGGNAFVRFGAESAWIHTWLHLVHKTLYIYNKGEKFDEVDLRKCKGLRSLLLADRCTKGFEMCSPLAIDLPSGRVIFIQSDLKKDQDGWFSALQDSIAMVDASLTYQALTSDNVPVMVDKCINFVSAFGLDVQGIYRLNGQNSKVTRLLEEFRSDTRAMIIRPLEYTVHDVATAVKRFFRQLDEPLLTNELYEGWIKASAITIHTTRLETYKSLLSSLPCINYHTLKRIVFHLAMVADKKALNKMDSTNLASIFGPILFKVDKDGCHTTGFGTTNQEIKILKDLVDDHQWIFDIKDEELDQEKKIADAVKRIEQLNMAKANQQTTMILEEGVLLGVYLNDKHGDVVTLKVSNTMTAEELQKFVAEKSREGTGKSWTLFEVICSGELERPIHSSEKILDVTMKWSNWPQEFCQDNYLCFKFNKLQEPLQLLHDYQSSSLFSELHYCSKRNFHKYCFQYTQCVLGFRKDTRAENPTTSWLVEDIVIYFGIQRIRHPPTQWGFTFYSLNDKLTVPYFGHSICCATEEEMYRWLSAMLYSQHQPGSQSSSERSSVVNNSNRRLTTSSSESNLNTTTSGASKWKLPFVKRR